MHRGVEIIFSVQKNLKKTNCYCHAATVIVKYSWVQNQKDYIISSNSNEIKKHISLKDIFTLMYDSHFVSVSIAAVN